MNLAFEKAIRSAEAEWKALHSSKEPIIMIGAATCGRSAGALDVIETFQKELNPVDKICLGK